jgi:hypothetical protein
MIVISSALNKVLSVLFFWQKLNFPKSLLLQIIQIIEEFFRFISHIIFELDLSDSLKPN